MNDWLYINGNKIHKTAIINDNVILGKGNVIYPFSCFGLPGFIRDENSCNSKIIIGNNNKFGLYSSIMVGKEGSTIIGNNNIIMNYVNIGHNVSIGDNNEIGAKSLLAGHSKIGNKNKIKISCTIRNRAIIGNENIIGMGSIITKNFNENRLIIYGNPASIRGRNEER